MLTNMGKVLVTGLIGNITGIGLSVHYYYLSHYGAMAAAIQLTVLSGMCLLGSTIWAIDGNDRHFFRPEENSRSLSKNQQRLDMLEAQINKINSYQEQIYNKLIEK